MIYLITAIFHCRYPYSSLYVAWLYTFLPLEYITAIFIEIPPCRDTHLFLRPCFFFRLPLANSQAPNRIVSLQNNLWLVTWWTCNRFCSYMSYLPLLREHQA